MKIYTVIGGLNGAGKSSLLGSLKSSRDDLGVIINVDDIAKSKNISNLEAGKIAVAKIDRLLNMGVSFTQETTLAGRKTLKTIKKAKDLGYFIRLYYIGVSGYPELLSRVKNRVKKGGHNISEEDLSRRYKKYEEDLLSVLPYADEAVLYDNENGFAEAARLKNGKLYKTAEPLPDWAKSVAEKYNEIYN